MRALKSSRTAIPNLGHIGKSYLLTSNRIYDYAASLVWWLVRKGGADAMAKKPGGKKKATKKKKGKK